MSIPPTGTSKTMKAIKAASGLDDLNVMNETSAPIKLKRW